MKAKRGRRSAREKFLKEPALLTNEETDAIAAMFAGENGVLTWTAALHSLRLSGEQLFAVEGVSDDVAYSCEQAGTSMEEYSSVLLTSQDW